MIHATRITAALTAFSLLLAPAMAQDVPPPVPDEAINPIRGDEITPEQQRAVERGLAWLASRQQPAGNFGNVGDMGSATGVTALGGIAFLAAGNLPGRGKYGQNVERALEFILVNSQESGLLAGEAAHGVMYSHGFATLFLAEVYGMTGDERVKEKLQKAVRLIQRSQNLEGGWRYQPVPDDADISVTICQIMALRAARDAGIKVEKSVIDKAIVYVRACQNRDGGFSYMQNRGGSGGSAFPRSAAGVASLFYAGVYAGDEIELGLKYVEGFTPGRPSAREDGHYFYGHYYAVQTMFLAGGAHWENWYPAIRNELVARQEAAGSWSKEVSQEYSTAMSLIILQMPNRYLPVFAGKGPGS